VAYAFSAIALVSLTLIGPVIAGEPITLQLRAQPVVEGQVVRIGDLVEVIHGRCQQTDDVMTSAVAPSPREGTPQTWTRSDLTQHLELRGIHVSAIRWMGAERTQLRHGKRTENSSLSGQFGTQSGSQPAGSSVAQASRGLPIPSRGQTPAFVQERAVKQTEMLLSQAITEYITLKTGDRTAWRITMSVPPQFVPLMQVKTNIVSIGGGQEPWEGAQEFVFEVKDRGALIKVPIQATLQLPPMIVTSTRAMRRDEMITADALTYTPLPNKTGIDPAIYFSDVNQLVGKQLRRSLTTGQPFETGFIGDPVVVTRGELVEVESVSGGIVVRTSGRATASGAVGDLIDIELLPSRSRILATVTEPLKVRVAAVPSRSKLN